MFYRYEIKNNNGDEVLYLYLSTKYEFSQELNYNDESNLKILSRNYIKTNNIPFKGNTIYLVVDGIITKKIDVSHDKSESEESYLPDKFLINLKLDDESICEITLRDYLLSVLFSLYSNDMGDEVLKSICVLYNTFCFKMMIEDKYILSNNNFVIYKPYSEYMSVYKNYSAVLIRLNRIIDDCSGIYICYNGAYILPFIHFCNSGKTLNNTKYPYLTSVKSLWDLTSIHYINCFDYSYEDLNKIFNININSSSKIEIKNNGSVVFFGNKGFTINEIKDSLGLSSSELVLIINNKSIKFICKGFGNGYGLSIYGASCIEMNGGKYNNILGYYFPKCKIFKYIKRLS